MDFYRPGLPAYPLDKRPEEGQKPMTGRLLPAGSIFFREAFMNNLNSILIEGNLVRDPLFRSTPKGTPVCTFTLASNRFFKQDSGLEKDVGFFDVETWAKLAEQCYNLGHKGRGVRVVGRLKQSRWNDTEGNSRSKVTIVAEHVEFRPEFKKNGSPEKIDDPDIKAPLAAGHPEDFSAAGMDTAGDSPVPVEELEPVTF
jgi:single-strand DNA-binding protein